MNKHFLSTGTSFQQNQVQARTAMGDGLTLKLPSVYTDYNVIDTGFTL